MPFCITPGYDMALDLVSDQGIMTKKKKKFSVVGHVCTDLVMGAEPWPGSF